MTDSESNRGEDAPAEDAVETALAAAFPDRDVQSVGGTGPSWNDKNHTVHVEFADGDSVFLKVAADGDGSRVARECAVVDYVRKHCNVAVPTVEAAASDGDVPYLATAPLGRHTLLDAWGDAAPDERTSLVRRVGRALASIHDQTFREHGHVTGGGATGLDIDAGTWTDVLVDRIGMLREIAPATRFDEHFDAVVAAVEANRDLLDDAPAVLVHGDPAQPNCVPGESGMGFLDWEIAHVGDPARELHRARDQLFDTEGEHVDAYADALHAGYRERAGSLPDGMAERTPVYDAVRYLGKSGFYEKWVEFADEDPEVVADQMATEMERRLDELR